MALDSNNLYKGTGTAYFKRSGETTARDIGSVALVNTTATVGLTTKMAARGGARFEWDSWVTQKEQTFELTLDEASTANFALATGGEVVDELTLSTTGDTTSNSKTLANLGSTAGLREGLRHWVSGTGLRDGSSFIYEGEDSSPDTTVTLDRTATASGTGVSLTITRPEAVLSLEDPQIKGEFYFITDNDVGPRYRFEARNVIITPRGTVTLLDSGNDDPATIELQMRVLKDDAGHFMQAYNIGTGGDIWTPA